jgi:hypothetical protein
MSATFDGPNQDLDTAVRLAQGIRAVERVSAGLAMRERGERKLVRRLCFAAFQAIEAARMEAAGAEEIAAALAAVEALEPYDEGEALVDFEPLLREHPMRLLEGAVRDDLIAAVMDRGSHKARLDPIAFSEEVMARLPEDLVRNYLERARETADAQGEGQREEFELVWKKLSKRG